jgi:hypothetical protein
VTECPPSSASVLHKQWAKLESEHHELAIAICAARAKKADVALMRKRQESLLREIGSLVAKIRNAPATTIEDFLALLDVALEHELDLACEMAFYGPADYPIITRLFRVLAREIPGFEFNSLRRWLSAPGQFEQLMERATHLETEENDGPPDEAKKIARSKPRRGGVIGRRQPLRRFASPRHTATQRRPRG